MTNAAGRSVFVLANPAARRAVPPATLEAAAAGLRARGWYVTIERTGSAEATRQRAADLARGGAEAVVACGGDGTLLAVVNGVREGDPAGDTTAVGVIPGGTANVWAVEARVPRDPAQALGLVDAGARRRMDLGVARIGDGRAVRFLLVCGAGMDAAVIEAVETRAAWKRRLGRIAFAAPALAALAAWPPVEATVTIDGVTHTHPRLLAALAAHGRRYGGVTTIARHGAPDDGLLEVTLFEGERALLDRLRLAAQAMRGGLDGRAVRGVTHARAAEITIVPARPVPVEVDGDLLGRCGPAAPLRITVEPRALPMIVGR